VSTSTYAVSQATSSFANLAFRSAKALGAMSCNMNAVKGGDDQFRISFEHGLIPEQEIG
jgi:hypothetical protein